MKEDLDQIYNKHLNNRFEKKLFTSFIIIYIVSYFIIIELFGPSVFFNIIGVLCLLIGIIAIVICIGRKYNIKTINSFTEKYLNASNKKIQLTYNDIKKYLKVNKLLTTSCILEIKKEYKKKSHFGTITTILGLYLSIVSPYASVFNLEYDMLTLLIFGIPLMGIFVICFINMLYEIFTNKDYFYYKTMNDIFYKLLGDCPK